jgi:hypothetical protein
MVNHTKLKEVKVDLSIRSRDYNNPESTSKGKETYDPQGPLHIENTEKETMSCIPKGVYKRMFYNPDAQDAPNYSIVEDLAQIPCAMSALEVIQSHPMQRTTLLSMIEAVDFSNQLTMKFDATDVKPHLPYHVSFQIDVVYVKHVIRRTIVDEGSSTYVMFLSF